MTLRSVNRAAFNAVNESKKGRTLADFRQHFQGRDLRVDADKSVSPMRLQGWNYDQVPQYGVRDIYEIIHRDNLDRLYLCHFNQESESGALVFYRKESDGGGDFEPNLITKLGYAASTPGPDVQGLSANVPHGNKGPY